MENKTPRKRAVNFSQAEKVILIDLISKYKDTLENKRSDIIFFNNKENMFTC